MTTLFEKAQSSIYEAAVAKVHLELEGAETKAANIKMLISGSTWQTREALLLESVTRFAETLIERLNMYEIEHSPIKTSDFELAKLSLKKYRKHCEKIYANKISNTRLGYPMHRAPFEGGKMDAVEENALNLLEGSKLTFKSKRSFFKLVLGDLPRQVWSFALLVAGAVLPEIFGLIVNVIKKSF